MSGAAIIRTRIPRIVPDPQGGWFLVFGSFGWLFACRRDAVLAAREITGGVWT